MSRRKWYGITRWSPEDVLTLDKDLTEAEAVEFLVACEREIQDIAVSEGWATLEILLEDWKQKDVG